MLERFSGSEIITLGIEIEKNGRDFYQTLAGQLRSSSVKEVLKFLADEEEKHINVFKKILAEADKFGEPALLSDEYLGYMSSLADNYVFTQKDKGREIAQAIATDEKAIDMGMGFEKDSILFYEGMKKTVAESQAKIVDELIREEQKHFRKLVDLKRQLPFDLKAKSK